MQKTIKSASWVKTMAQALNKNDIFYDPVLNAVLQADGVMDSNNNHQFTMLWPSYTALDMHDSVLKRMMAATYDHWTNMVEYYDSALCMTIKIDLTTGMQSNVSGVSQSVKTQSQQNWGWTGKDESKKPEAKRLPFSVGSILFHKTSRTKWVFAEVDNVTRHPVLRSFYDKSQAMQIFERDYEEFEEIFF